MKGIHMKKKLFFPLLCVFTAILLFIFSVILGIKQSEEFKKGFFIYPCSQYLAESIKDPISINFLIIDTNGQKQTFESDYRCSLIAENGQKYEAEDFVFSVSSQNKNYTLYDLNMTLNMENLNVKRYSFHSIEFENEKEQGEIFRYSIGKATLDLRDGITDTENISFGASPFADDTNGYLLYCENKTTTSLIIEQISFDVNVDDIGSVTGEQFEKIEIMPGEARDIIVPMKDITDRNVILKPFVTYSAEGNQYIGIPTVSTKYLSEISEKEILEYINGEAG